MIKSYPNISNLSKTPEIRLKPSGYPWLPLSPLPACTGHLASPLLNSSSSLPFNHWPLTASTWMDRKYLATLSHSVLIPHSSILWCIFVYSTYWKSVLHLQLIYVSVIVRTKFWILLGTLMATGYLENYSKYHWKRNDSLSLLCALGPVGCHAMSCLIFSFPEFSEHWLIQ